MMTHRGRAWRVIALALAIAPLAVQLQAQTTPTATEPIWAKPDHFWYRKTVPGGHVWLNVDALHGVKEPLFDHQRLAIELGIRTGYEFTPLTLPFGDPSMHFVVKYDGSNAYIQEGAMAIEFVLDGFLWRCDLQIKWDWNRVPPTDYECLSRRPAVAPPPPAPAIGTEAAPRTSPDGRWSAFVLDHNVVVRAAADAAAVPKRLSTDGTPAFAYQPGSLQWSKDSRTLTAYRVSDQVWRSDSVTGNVKSLVVRREFAQ
jgi:hypothetical protein